MKNLKDLIRKPKKIPPKPKAKPNMWKRKPTPIEQEDNLLGICRILPSYVAKNFDFFMLLAVPRHKVKDWDAYIIRIKQKINCLKSDF